MVGGGIGVKTVFFFILKSDRVISGVGNCPILGILDITL